MVKKIISVFAVFVFFLATAAYAARFQHNGDGTVTDNKTGLMWQLRAPTKLMNWHTAMEYCENLVLAGHNDWCLPSEKELHELSGAYFHNPQNFLNYFPDTRDYFYWTSTKAPFGGPCDPPGYSFCEAFYTDKDKIISLDYCMRREYLLRAVRNGSRTNN
jgi:hypothetical protein